jgi:hypothetical protein
MNISQLVLSAILGITTAIITIIIISYRDVISSSFRLKPRNISGFWEGDAIYQSDRSSRRGFTCKLKQLGPRVSGTLASAGEFATEYKVEGHFFESEYVVITITNANASMLNYATGILRLNKFGNELVGSFVGRARTTEDAVAGTLLLKRK